MTHLSPFGGAGACLLATPTAVLENLACLTGWGWSAAKKRRSERYRAYLTSLANCLLADSSEPEIVTAHGLPANYLDGHVGNGRLLNDVARQMDSIMHVE